MSQGTEVSIMTRLWVWQPKKFVLIPGSSQGFFSSKHPHQPWDKTHPPIWRVPGALYPKAKLLEHEADHVPESSSDLKNEGGCTCATPYTLMACTGRTLPLLYTSNSSASIM